MTHKTVQEEYRAHPELITRGMEIRGMPIEEIRSLKDLDARRLLAWKESDDANHRLYGSDSSYSYPAHQLRAIEKQKSKLIDELSTCSGEHATLEELFACASCSILLD